MQICMFQYKCLNELGLRTLCPHTTEDKLLNVVSAGVRATCLLHLLSAASAFDCKGMSKIGAEGEVAAAVKAVILHTYIFVLTKTVE